MSLAFMVDALLWVIAIVLGILVWRRSVPLFKQYGGEGATDFLKLVPRIAIGVTGAGFVAELLPQQTVAEWLGPDSGFLGLIIATVGGFLTPGGPVVGFAIGVSALKAGAGVPQVICYVTAWALFAMQRLFVWEFGVMPQRLVWLRLAASLPVPILAAVAAMLLGRR